MPVNPTTTTGSSNLGSGYGLSYADLKRYVSRYLGYDYNNLNTLQTQDVNDAIQAGYRRFLDPPPTERNGLAHQWSFLQNIVTLNLVADQYVYNLPSDLQSVKGTVTFSSPSSLYRAQVTQISENDLRRLREADMPEHKWPYHFALRYNSSGQPDMLFYPTPSESYAVEFSYHVRKAALGSGGTILGGDVHAETVLAACLAAAERLMEEASGVHEQQFQERIRASIDVDKRSSASFFGYNGDREVYDYRVKSINITHENQS